jgi:dinuclear metal center YbgI/SA1388 family protein
MKIKEIINVLEEFAPLQLQESYDNSGLVCGNPELEINGALCALDVTEAVVEEAIGLNANLIVSHHPVIFQGLKTITGKTFIEKVLIKAIKNDISIYTAHTNIDNIFNGVNKTICDKIGLTDCRILQPLKNKLLKIVTFVPVAQADKVREALFKAGAGHIGNYNSCSYNADGQGTFRGGENTNPFVGEKGQLHFEKETRIETVVPGIMLKNVVAALIDAHPYEEVAYDIYPLENKYSMTGAGMIGKLKTPLNPIAFLENLKTTFRVPVIKYTGNDNNLIEKVAVCGGSGSFLLEEAIKQGAHAFVTGDVKYHQFFNAENKLLFCDIGHYESEQFTKEIFYSVLLKKFSTFAVHLSQEVTSPIKYY